MRFAMYSGLGTAATVVTAGTRTRQTDQVRRAKKEEEATRLDRTTQWTRASNLPETASVCPSLLCRPISQTTTTQRYTAQSTRFPKPVGTATTALTTEYQSDLLKHSKRAQRTLLGQKTSDRSVQQSFSRKNPQTNTTFRTRQRVSQRTSAHHCTSWTSQNAI